MQPFSLFRLISKEIFSAKKLHQLKNFNSADQSPKKDLQQKNFHNAGQSPKKDIFSCKNSQSSHLEILM